MTEPTTPTTPTTIVARIATKFAAPLLVKALLVAVPLLVASLAFNLHQFGKSYAAEAECRANTAEAVLKAIEAHKEAQAAAQREIDERARLEAGAATERLADIAGSAGATLADLAAIRRKYADEIARRPLDCARLPADGLRMVNAYLARPRPD